MKPILFLPIVVIFISIFTIGITFAQVAPVLGLPHAIFKTDNGEYQIQYNITNARLEATFVDIPARAFMFIINATKDGQLSVDLPRKIIDSTRDDKDRPFFVSLGDPTIGLKRIKTEEISNNPETRIVTINFTKGLSQVQLSGTFFVENSNPRTNIHLYNGEMSPLKQWLLGTDSLDVICKNSFQLIIKARDGLPACVKPETKSKLIERGWAFDSDSTMIILGPMVDPDENPFPLDKENKIDLTNPKIPRDKDGFIDYDKLVQLVSKPQFGKLLSQRGIEFDPNDIVLMTGPRILIYTPYGGSCGYVVAQDKQVYWLESFLDGDTLTKCSIYDENPDPCKPNYSSCFCDAQYDMTKNTITELSYFDKSQELYVGQTFQKYLNEGAKVVNVPKYFVVGDHNFEMKPDETTFCGAFVSQQNLKFNPDGTIQGVGAYHYFSGIIKNDKVISFGLEDPMKLCAINHDAQIFGFR